MPEGPRNLVVISADELRGDCPGFMGNPDCRTPHLDRLAAEGVVFTRHFTVHGKCVPARIAMQTGRYPHTDGFRTITGHLPPTDPNLLGFLRKQGYETAVFGLNHVWEGLFDTHEPHAGVADWHSFAGHYHHIFDRSFYPVEQPGPASRTPLHVPEGYHYAGRITEPLTGFCDDCRTDQAIDYLCNTRDRNRPFYMHLNLSAPHPKYRVEEPFFSMYDPHTLQAWPCDLPRNAPLPLRAMRRIRTGAEPDEGALREVRATYYGMITKVDQLIGKVIRALDGQGLADETVLLFWVDHGDFAGQYGLVEKWDTAMCDCIMHVPMVLRAPELPAGCRVDSLTEHVDVAPTLLELLGFRPDWHVHGESLLPAVRGERRKHAVFADGGHEEEMWGRFNFAREPAHRPENSPLDGKQRTYRDVPESMARTKMVRTERMKLVVRLAGGNELYDLMDDPFELDNLWGQPGRETVTAELLQLLVEWCLRTDTDRPFQARVGA